MAARKRRTSRRRGTGRRRSSRRSRRVSRNRASDREVERDFRRLVTNMTPASERTLPLLLARTKATPPSQWTAAMRDKARRAVAFVTAGMNVEGYGSLSPRA